MLEEAHMMTVIDDPANSIRNPETCKQKERELRKKYMLNENFIHFNDEILQLVI